MRGFEENSKIIFLISKQKHTVQPVLSKHLRDNQNVHA